MVKGRKRVLAIGAGILVARHLKTTEELFDTRHSRELEAYLLLPFSGRSGLWEGLTRSLETTLRTYWRYIFPTTAHASHVPTSLRNA